MAIAAAVLLLPACSGPAELSDAARALVSGDCRDDTGRTVTIYSGRTENLIGPILEAFACESGISVQVRWGESSDLALLIDEEGDATDADVFLSRSPGPVGFLEAEGRLTALPDDILELVEEQNRASAGTWVGFSGRKRVLVYNTDEVSVDELPASVLDLTSDAYRGRVAIPATNGSFEDWFTVFRNQVGDEAATAWLDAMVDNDARYYANNRAIVEAVGRGEIDLGLVNHYYNFQVAESTGSGHHGQNYDFAPGDIGSLLIVTAAAVTDTADDPEAANELIRFLLGEPAQRYFTEETYEYPLAAGVEPAAILPPLTPSEVGTVDFDSLGGGFAETERIIQESGILNQ